jgi:hypothetical protein
MLCVWGFTHLHNVNGLNLRASSSMQVRSSSSSDGGGGGIGSSCSSSELHQCQESHRQQQP